MLDSYCKKEKALQRPILTITLVVHSFKIPFNL